ncbi:hypothetical protein V8F06_007911 [Rhypophila decipiens]
MKDFGNMCLLTSLAAWVDYSLSFLFFLISLATRHAETPPRKRRQTPRSISADSQPRRCSLAHVKRLQVDYTGLYFLLRTAQKDGERLRALEWSFAGCHGRPNEGFQTSKQEI